MLNKNKSPFISKVSIKNYRNFLDEEVILNHKQVIIGENNVGKTNFLRAIQLILDPSLNEEDRYLEESDFNDSLENPFENNLSIEISIEIQGFENNISLLSTFASATVNETPPTLRFTYIYKATDDGNYSYNIYQGINEENPFTHKHRKMLNIKVINGLRDANNDLKNIRKSPLNKLIKQYDFDRNELDDIALRMKGQSDSILSLEEIIDLKERVNLSLSSIVGNNNPYSNINLETIDINHNKILNTLRLMIGDTNKRPTNETSLGVTNVLYISLILLSIEDGTVPKLIKKDIFTKLLNEDSDYLLQKNYSEVKQEYFKLNNVVQDYDNLYSFFSEHFPSVKGHTILAIEEPEAHLHPILQRCIFKDVMKKSTSIILTTHSSDLTSIAPINSIVHLRLNNNTTLINSTAAINLTDKELMDLQRYIDVKRGEIFFGKGVILVEGIAEEYLVPAFAEQLNKNLDYYGVVCCNINSTNFKPYICLLRALKIPYVILTDGDYYYFDPNTGEKKFHELYQSNSNLRSGLLGMELAHKTLYELGIFQNEKLLKFDYAPYNNEGFFFSLHTLEIDIMYCSTSLEAKKTIINVFSELSTGGEQQKQNFKNDLENGEFYSCLNKIESSSNKIGKGRFAQRLSSSIESLVVPHYISVGIEAIILKISRGE